MFLGFDIKSNQLSKYDGNDTDIIIPEGIVEIGEYAFSGNASITSVKMPNTVRRLGDGAFKGCAKLKAIEVSDQLMDIGSNCFCGCKALKELILPETIESVGYGAFAGCVKLKTLQCDSTRYIPGDNPFHAFDEEEPQQLADENGLMVFAGVLFKYIKNGKEVIIPETVRYIWKSAFTPDYGVTSNLKRVVVPQSVKTIDENAFSRCKHLSEIEMPSGIEFGDRVFSECEKLADKDGFFIYDGIAHAYFGNSDSIVVPEGTRVLSSYLFYKFEYGSQPGAQMQAIQLPESLEEIGERVFYDCKKLSSITVPDNVKKIGDGAFENCSSLKNVKLPDNIDEMGRGAFSGCIELADDRGFVIQKKEVHSYYGNDQEVIIPEGIESIASGVFNKSKVISVKLPTSLKRLGASFVECSFLSEIAIPEGTTDILPATFKGCSRLRKVVLPSTIKRIGRDAFSGCNSLEAITIPEHVEVIESGAFSHCRCLKSVILPNGIEKLETEIFKDCTSLENVKLPSSLKSIENEAFGICEKLRTIEIPDTVESIGDMAFYRCTALSKISYSPIKATIHEDAFGECDSLADDKGLTIIAGILWDYDGPGGHVEVPEGVKILHAYAFAEGYAPYKNRRGNYRQEGSLTGITFPSTLKRIGEDAFLNCKGMNMVLLPASLELIGKEAFQGCSALKEIAIPSAVSSIGADAFRDCENLSAIDVDEENAHYSSEDGILMNKAGDEILFYPGGKSISQYKVPAYIKVLGDHSFISCKSLGKITIPETVERIGDEVFAIGEKPCDIVVVPGAGSVSVGSNVFGFFDRNTPLVYPKIPVTFVREQKLQVRLALGFCQHPEQYDGVYAQIYQGYAKSHEKTLIKRADVLNLNEVAQYFSAIDSSDTAKRIAGTINYSKLSPKAKVEMLESAVLENDLQKAKTVIDNCKKFEFTPRALGLACLYSSLEMVELLVDNGATFEYNYDSTLKRKYGAAYATKYTPYPVNYSELISRTDIDVYNPMVFAWTHEFHFGNLPKTDSKENSEEERADIAEYLLTAKKAAFDAPTALYYAILWGSTKVADRLMENGVAVSDFYLQNLYYNGATIDRNEVVVTLPSLSPEKCLYALKAFHKFLEGTGNKIILNQRVFDVPRGETRMVDGNVLEFLFAETDTSKIVKSKVLEKAIDADDAKAVEVLVSAGALRTAAQREKAIALASKNKKTEVLAWFLEYKNRIKDTADKTTEKNIMKELMEDPNSVSALKKKWSYKKLANGTLEITSYKSDEEDVIVPSRIGKADVTIIQEGAFAAQKVNRSYKKEYRENRESIRSVTVPEGITVIGDYAFYGCKSLELLNLPETVKSIGVGAFSGCTKLQRITLPKRVRILWDAFHNCDSLYDENGFIVQGETLYSCNIGKVKQKEIRIPEHIKEIAPYAFYTRHATYSGIEKIVCPEGLRLIGNNAFERLYSLKEISIPSGIKEIREYCFRRTGLERVVIPAGIIKIGQQAFQETNLTEIRLPSSVEEIGAYAFYECEKLKDVYISANTIKLGKGFIGDPDDSGWKARCKPQGVIVHTPDGSAAEDYMKQYSGVAVVNDYTEK